MNKNGNSTPTPNERVAPPKVILNAAERHLAHGRARAAGLQVIELSNVTIAISVDGERIYRLHPITFHHQNGRVVGAWKAITNGGDLK